MSDNCRALVSGVLIAILLLAIMPSNGYARRAGHSGESRTHSGRYYSGSATKPHPPPRAYHSPGNHARPQHSYRGNGGVRREHDGKIARDLSARDTFLRQRGLSRVPKGYQVDHRIPLYAGGQDTPSNMQLLTTSEHRAKTKADYRRYRR